MRIAVTDSPPDYVYVSALSFTSLTRSRIARKFLVDEINMRRVSVDLSLQATTSSNSVALVGPPIAAVRAGVRPYRRLNPLDYLTLMIYPISDQQALLGRPSWPKELAKPLSKPSGAAQQSKICAHLGDRSILATPCIVPPAHQGIFNLAICM
jgi:hypothetical protein